MRSEASRLRRAAYGKAWREANREQWLAISRASYRKHREKRLAEARAYQQAHPEWAAARVRVRYARQRSAGGSHTVAEWLDKCALLGNVCFYCGADEPLTEDHKTPIVHGGADDITNIVPACASCNTRKGTKTAREFLAVA